MDFDKRREHEQTSEGQEMTHIRKTGDDIHGYFDSETEDI